MNRADHSEQPIGIDEFLASVAARSRTQARLSIAALTAAACASQLEAQCREVLELRRYAPGPDNVAALIDELQDRRQRLTALMHHAFAMETASARTLRLPDARFEDRLRKQVTHESQLTEFLTAGLEAAELLEGIARSAARVRKLRREVRGGSPTEVALLGAASVAVLDVVQRALRWSRVRDPAVRARSLRAISRLRALSVLPIPDDVDNGERNAPMTLDGSRWN